MSKGIQQITTLLACAALPLAVACADDATGPAITRGGGSLTAEVARMTLEPDNVVLHLGESVQLYAELADGQGTPLAAGVMGSVHWSSSRPGVVAVNYIGMLQALAAGKAVITADYGEHRAYASVTVLPPGDIDPPGKLERSAGR